jgi:hypothetical protein
MFGKHVHPARFVDVSEFTNPELWLVSLAVDMDAKLLEGDKWIPHVCLTPVGEDALESIAENATGADVVVHQRVGDMKPFQRATCVMEDGSNHIQSRRGDWFRLGASLLTHSAVEIVHDLIDVRAKSCEPMICASCGAQCFRDTCKLLLKIRKLMNRSFEVFERL